MEEKTIEITDKGLSQRSEEVQEIMGPMPHWILRWGITLIAVVFIGLLAGSWFFRYPDVLQTSCTLTPTASSETIIAPASGTVTFLRDNSISTVQEGDTLCLIKDAAGLTHVLLAPHASTAEAAISLTEGSKVNHGQELFMLSPLRQSSVLCLVQIPVDKIATVHVGQEAEVLLPQYPEEDFGAITGRIARISHFPDTNDLFTARIDFPCPITTSTRHPVRITYPMKGTVKIGLSNKRLIEKILESRE